MTFISRPSSSTFPPFYLITPWFGTFAGGGGRTFSTLAEMFTRCGFDTTVLTTCSKSPYQDWRTVTVPEGQSDVDGVRVLRFPVDQSNADPYHAAVSARMRGMHVSEELQDAFYELGLNSQALIRYVATLPSEAVIIAGHYFQSLVPSVINANPGRVVALPAFHDEPEFYWAPIGRLMRNARQILFISEEEKDLAIRGYGLAAGRRLVEAPVVGLGVELSKQTEATLQDEDSLARTLSRFRLPTEYLVYVGRIESGKGLSYLMPWTVSLNERRVAGGKPPIPLVLVGEGPPDVVPKSPFLKPVGYLSEEEKIAVIKHATGLINPSTLESFSYVVMEAWLAGTPVLVPAACAVTSGHVERCGGGIIFKDEHDFSAKVESLMQGDRRDALGERGRQYVRKNFRWPDVVDRILRAVLQ
jgi:glycosyltransferase involved in cell wall biosynthesis